MIVGPEVTGADEYSKIEFHEKKNHPHSRVTHP